MPLCGLLKGLLRSLSAIMQGLTGLGSIKLAAFNVGTRFKRGAGNRFKINNLKTMQKLIIYNKTGNPSESFPLDDGLSVCLPINLLMFESEGKKITLNIQDLVSFDVVLD